MRVPPNGSRCVRLRSDTTHSLREQPGRTRFGTASARFGTLSGRLPERQAVPGRRQVPTYEYRCDTCDKNFDVVQSFPDDPLAACPTVGSPVRKVFGSVGIVCKGSGFYKTDSRDGKTRSGASDKGSGDVS